MDKKELKLNNIRKKISALVNEFAQVAYEPVEFDPEKTVVPVSGKVIDGDELGAMVDASLDGWLTTGRFNAAFEKKLAEFVGVKHCLTVNSGSSANLVAFSTLTSPKLRDKAIKKGDEIIGVAAGFPTTINPIIQFGAVPVFVDIDRNTLNIDATKIEQAVTPKTKAIMLAHSLGNPFNLEKVKSICTKYNLWLIEDCCDALGSTYAGRKVGTFGDLATLSFYPAHHITMGEGGAVLTNDLKLKKIAESFRDWGRDCFCSTAKDNTCGKRFTWTSKRLGGNLPDGYDHKYIYSHLGYNLKISDMQAACAFAQMEKLEGFILKRQENFEYLKSELSVLDDYLILPEATSNSKPSWFGFPMVMQEKSPAARVNLLEYLTSKRIGTRLLFAGNVTKQPYMEHQTYRIANNLKNTEIAMNSTFWIGVFPGLGKDHLNYVVTQLKNYFL